MKKEIPFYKQILPTYCGAACLQMVYEFFGIRRDQIDIFHKINEVVNGQPIGMLDKMVSDIINSGLHGMAFHVRDGQDVRSAIESCINDFILIPLYHRTANVSIGHFSVIKRIEGNSIYVNDPSGIDGGDKRYNIKSFIDLMLKRKDPSETLIHSNCFIAVSEKRASECYAELPCPNDCRSVSVASMISDFSDVFLCPNCGMWFTTGEPKNRE